MIDILSLANLLHESIRVRGKADREPDAALSSRLLVALEGSKPIRLERNDVYLCGRSLKHTSFPCMNEVHLSVVRRDSETSKWCRKATRNVLADNRSHRQGETLPLPPNRLIMTKSQQLTICFANTY